MLKNLGHIEVVRGACRDCLLYGASYCYDQFKNLVGFDCANEDAKYILKKKERWETCTKENIKIGDTVRWLKDADTEYKVTHIFKTRNRFMVEDSSGFKCFNSQPLSNYEVKEK